MTTEIRNDRIVETLRHRQPDLTVVIENIHDPHNVSAIFRSCDAVGVPEVHLVYTTEKFPKIGKKSSSSANKWVGKRKHNSIDECYAALRSEGFLIYATHLDDSSKSLYELDLTQKVAIVVGNEHRGVSEEASRSADLTFRIPQYGMIRSLNVSVATAVTLFEALRQRIQKNHYAHPKYDSDQLRELMEIWSNDK